jgi:acyl-ACP thioesterase
VGESYCSTFRFYLTKVGEKWVEKEIFWVCMGSERAVVEVTDFFILGSPSKVVTCKDLLGRWCEWEKMFLD